MAYLVESGVGAATPAWYGCHLLALTQQVCQHQSGCLHLKHMTGDVLVHVISAALAAVLCIVQTLQAWQHSLVCLLLLASAYSYKCGQPQKPLECSQIKVLAHTCHGATQHRLSLGGK